MLKARDTWPRANRVFCAQDATPWDETAEMLDEVAMLLCRRRGAAMLVHHNGIRDPKFRAEQKFEQLSLLRMMVAMAIEVGLRARKKIKTRQQIYEAAHALFAVRGFDGVTVAEVAQAAEVSEPTVFNYFPTKEDLFFGGLESFEARLVIGVAGRKAGESASGAFLRLLLESSKRLEDGNNLKVIAAAAKLIAASPPLQVREREIVAVYTRELARELALERRQGLNDIEAFTVANALMGLHRALVEHVRRQVTSGARAAEIAAEFRTHARRAFKRLDAGLRGYAVKEAGISNG